jgi:hypothetical protein
VRRVLVPPFSVPRPLRQDASNPFLQPTFTSRVPAEDSSFGDCPPSAVGNPPASDIETAFAPRACALLIEGAPAAPDRLSVIRPPTAPRLTARRWLRARRLPRSARPVAVRRTPCVREGRLPGFFGRRCLCRLEPSDTSFERRIGIRTSRCAPVPPPDSASTSARQCVQLPRSRGAFRRESPPPGPFRAPAWRCRPRWPAGAAAARVHRWLESQSTRPLFTRSSRAPSRPRALARLLQVVVSASTTTDHPNIPNDRIRRWDDCLFRFESRLSSRATARASQGQGPRTPCLGAPHRDCSWWRLCPDPDRPGHLLSREPFFSLSGATWEKGGTASATHACTAHVATGPCGVPPPRRGETLTSPRGLPSTTRSRCETGAAQCPTEAGRGPRQRLFHHRRDRARDARAGPDGSTSGHGKAVNRPPVLRPQRP